MYFNRKCKITFISNGATIYSDEGRFSDAEVYPPLNEAGQEEIEKICDFLRKRGIKNDQIYSSPATRTVQSAKLVAKVYKTDFEILEDLHPRKCGQWNGLTYEQVEAKYPNALDEMLSNPEKSLYDAESITDFVNRVGITIDSVVDNNIGNRVIIVTHPEIIKAAICLALNIPHSSLQHIHIKTGSATQISYFEKWKSLIYSGYTPL